MQRTTNNKKINKRKRNQNKTGNKTSKQWKGINLMQGNDEHRNKTGTEWDTKGS